MHINSLPTDVLFAILKPYCEKEAYMEYYGKRPTNILSVCQKWRRLALPMIFNTIYVNANDGLWTNADIMPHHMKQYPRTVDIMLDYTVNGPRKDVENILEKLESIEGMLGNVVNLSLTFDVYGSFFDFEEEELLVPEIDYIEMARKLYALLSNISSLHFENDTEDDTMITFESTLLRLYAPQLTQVTVSPMAINSDICFSKCLSKFTQSWACDATVLPKINADNLTRLKLTCVQESFNWSAFSKEKSDDSGILRFPALEFMSISMYGYISHGINNPDRLFMPGNKFAYTLEVPSLVYLRVSALCPLGCSLIASISTHRTLNKFVMSDMDNIEFEFYGFSISNATKYVFEKHCKSTTANKEADIMEVANDLQAIDGLKCSAIEAHVNREISTSEVQRIYWPQVTRLKTYNPISLSNLLKLIGSSLPNLIKLEAYCIELSDMKDSAFVIPEIQDGSIAPIETKIKKLVYGLGEYGRGVPDEVHRVFVDSIAKILRSLEFVVFKNP